MDSKLCITFGGDGIKMLFSNYDDNTWKMMNTKHKFDDKNGRGLHVESNMNRVKDETKASQSRTCTYHSHESKPHSMITGPAAT